MWILRLCAREILAQKTFSVLFCLNVSLGLVGYLSLDSFKRGFEAKLAASAKTQLSADLTVSVRRPFSEQERSNIVRHLPSGSLYHERTSIYSMGASEDKSSLLQVRAVGRDHPYYGGLTLRNGGQRADSIPLQDSRKVWVYPEVLFQLGVSIGDEISLGEGRFVIDDVIEDDEGLSFGGLSYAPRVYVGQDALKDTGLLSFGSTQWRSLMIKLPQGVDPEKVRLDLDQAIPEPGIQITTFEKAGQEDGRLFRYLSDYLGLAALVAFFLSAIGAAYLFRSYLTSRQKDAAILLALGARPRASFRIHSMQILILGSFAGLLSFAISFAIVPIIKTMLRDLMDFDIDQASSTTGVLSAIFLGSIGSLLICLPLLVRIRQCEPARLFQEFSRPSFQLSRRSVVAALPALASFFLLSALQSKSWIVGSIFFVSLLASAFLLGFFGIVLIRAFGHVSGRLPLAPRMALRYLAASKVNSISTFLALSLGALLLNLIPQLQHSLSHELSRPAEPPPSFFLFNIREDQKEPLLKTLDELGSPASHVSPMIRARLISINGQPFEKSFENDIPATREDQQATRFRNRGLNLTYRPGLYSSERITQGRPFPGPWDGRGKAEISIEKRYAGRMGISLGDILVIEVQGIPIELAVTSVRRVKWQSFQPNFFMQVQPGVLEDAPKAFIVTVSSMPAGQKATFQKALVSAFPNLSMIDVGKLVAKILEIADAMAGILSFMALLSMLAGFAVLVSIANHQAYQRRWDSNLQKILGSTPRALIKTVAIEFAALSSFAALGGGLLSLVVSYFLSSQVFGSVWSPDWLTPIVTGAGIVGVAALAAALSTAKVARAKPALYL